MLLVIDIGTTVIKAALIDYANLSILASTKTYAKLQYTENGGAELDPIYLFDKIREVILGLHKINENVKKAEGLVIVSHIAGVVAVDKKGEPLTPIMTWLDERARGYPKEVFSGLIRVEGYNLFRLLRHLIITGGVPSRAGKDPLSKILWLRDNMTDAFRKANKFLDVKSFIIHKLTGEYIATPDEASLTWLLDTRTTDYRWSESIIESYNLDVEYFPEVRHSVDIVGNVRENIADDLGLNRNIVVVGGASDLAAVAVGSGAVNDNEPHIYIGTSSWIAAHVPKRIADLRHYMGSIPSAIPNKYLFVAEQETAMGALEWFIELLGLEKSSKLYQKIDEEVLRRGRNTSGIIFVPWMYGERSPINDEDVRGVMIGLSLRHNLVDIYKSLLEGIAFNIGFSYQFYEKKIGKVKSLRVAGGGALYESLCIFLADTLGRTIERISRPQEVGLLGGAIIGGVGLGHYRDFKEASRLVKISKVYNPDSELHRKRSTTAKIFTKLYKNLKPIFKHLKWGV